MSASSGYGGGSTPVGPVIETLTGNTGGPVGPTGNNINIIGSGGVNVAGNPGTSTLTITVSGIATVYTEDTGTAAPSGGNLNVLGGNSTAGKNIHTVGSGSTIDIILNDSLFFPNTNGSGSEGVLFWGGDTFVHNFGTDNTYLGANAGNLTGIGINNVGIGTNSLTAETAASNMISIGANAMLNMLTGVDCIAIGKQAMTLGTALESSVAIGTQALSQCLTGIFNIAIGEQAGTDYTGDESSNILINSFGIVGENNVMRLGTDGVGVGEQDSCYVAGVANRNFTANNYVVQIDTNFKMGSSNGSDGQVLIAATGVGSMWANLTAGANIVIANGPNSIEISATGSGGGGAVDFPTDSGTAVESGGILNVFGAAGSSGVNNIRTTGSGNTVGVILADSLHFSNTNISGTEGVLFWGGNTWIHNYGANNTFVGQDAGNLTLTTGSATQNVAIGTTSGNALTIGAQNTFLGYFSGPSITTGGDNTAVGFLTLSQLVTGGSNVAIGADAGIAYTSNESSNILISNIGDTGDQNTIRIGTEGTNPGQQDACYIAGIYNADIGTTNAPVFIDSNGKLGTKEAASSLNGSSFMAVLTGAELLPSSTNQEYHWGTNMVETVLYDNFGSAFFPGTGTGSPATFTAPVNGFYTFTWAYTLSILQITQLFNYIILNGTTYYSLKQGNFTNSGNWIGSMINTINIQLTAGDVITFGLQLVGSNLNPIQLFGFASNTYQTYAMGTLLMTAP